MSLQRRRGVVAGARTVATGGPITGDIASTLPALVQAVAGSVEVRADIAATLPALEQAATGTVLVGGAVTADIASTLPALTQAATGSVPIIGDIAATLPALEQAATGTVASASVSTQSFDGTTVPAPERFAGGQAFMFARLANSNARQVFTWDAAGTAKTDVEVLAKLATVRDDQRLGVAVRVSGSASSETMYVMQQYDRTRDEVSTVKYDSGSFSVLSSLSGGQYTMVASRWFWLRLRANGSTIKGKFWLDGETEPTTGGPDGDGYQLKDTDTAVAGAGGIGLFQLDANDAGTDLELGAPKYCDYLSVGFDGEVAPDPVDTPNVDQLATDFSGETASLVGAASGWTVPWTSSNAASRYVDDGMAPRLLPAAWRPYWNTALLRNDSTVLDWTPPSADRLMYGWHDLGTFSDVEVNARVKSGSAWQRQLRVYARASGFRGNESGYYAEFGPQLTTSTNELQLHKYVNGAATNLDSVSFSFAVDTWYRIKLRCDGTTIKAKAWADTATEPTTGGPDGDGYQLKATDTSLSSGVVGFGSLSTQNGDSPTKSVSELVVDPL